MFNKLFLAFVACATILATAILFFQNNKELLPSQQSPWTAIGFVEPANEDSLSFFIQNNSPETREFTYSVQNGQVYETNTFTLNGGEKRTVVPTYVPDSNTERITIEVRDDLTTQKIYR